MILKLFLIKSKLLDQLLAHNTLTKGWKIVNHMTILFYSGCGVHPWFDKYTKCKKQMRHRFYMHGLPQRPMSTFTWEFNDIIIILEN